ncbi:MAG TPA: Stp1/IreP family PP2C-type Ser/Thr phosphatase [Longimicrobiales bacterium]
MRWIATGITDRGLRREANEDAYRIREDAGLFLVADGMGGHAAGEVASTMAAAIVESETVRALEAGTDARPCEILRDAVEQAHRAILDHAARDPATTGMGTTLTATLLRAAQRTIHIAHVGDSRAYRLRDHDLARLTTDHTWVQQQVDDGRLTEAEARAHPLSSVLTRAVGGPIDALDVDLVDTDLADEDLLLLCTDGLSGTVDDADLRAILDRPLPLETLAAQLVEAANLRGGPDNITAVLIRVTA